MGLNKQTSPSWRKKLVHEWLCTKQLPTGLEQMPVALSCPDSHRNCTWSKTGRDKVINSSLVLQRSKRVKTISHSNYLPGTGFSGQQNAFSKRTGVIKLLVMSTNSYYGNTVSTQLRGRLCRAEIRWSAVRNSLWWHWIRSQGWEGQICPSASPEEVAYPPQACTEEKMLSATIPANSIWLL